MLKQLRHHWRVETRREFFTRAGSGLAGIALANMLAEDGFAAASRGAVDPLAPRRPHHAPRGMLQDTLVVWGGEFGRTPFNELGAGRDHNPWGFTMWMAGGGVKGGQYIGSTDEIGLRAAEHPVHVHDVHASILYLLGLNHLQLTYPHNGRPERPAVFAGEVVKPLFS